MRLIAIIAFAALWVPLTATAGSGCGASEADVVQEIFDGADQNQDGSLTKAEYEDAGLQEFGASFEASDANADGETSLTEYFELYDRSHEQVDQPEV